MSELIIGFSQFVFLWFTIQSLLDEMHQSKPIFRLNIAIPYLVGSLGMTLGLILGSSIFGAISSGIMSLIWAYHSISEYIYVRSNS